MQVNRGKWKVWRRTSSASAIAPSTSPYAKLRSCTAAGGGRHRVEHGLERVVVHLDELRRVLREVAVARDDDRDRLADVAHGVDRRRVLRDAGLDPGGKRAGQLGDVGPGQDADDAGRRERRGRVHLDPGVGEL